jgi:hypothetical protein
MAQWTAGWDGAYSVVNKNLLMNTAVILEENTSLDLQVTGGGSGPTYGLVAFGSLLRRGPSSVVKRCCLRRHRGTSDSSLSYFIKW